MRSRKMGLRLVIVWLALFASVRCLAQLHFSSDAKIDVWKAGVRSSSSIADLDLRFSSDRFLAFNVIWSTSGPVVVGDLTTGGWHKTLVVGVSSGGVATRTTTESLVYEVKLVSVSDETAIVTVEWIRTDSLKGKSQKGTLVICTINKTAPNEVGVVGDGSKLASVETASASVGSTAAGFAGGAGTRFSGGVAQGGHWEQRILHGQSSYVDENGDFVIVGWITYAYVWVPDAESVKNMQMR